MRGNWLRSGWSVAVALSHFFLESANRLADAFGQFRQLPRSKHKQRDRENDKQLRQTDASHEHTYLDHYDRSMEPPHANQSQTAEEAGNFALLETMRLEDGVIPRLERHLDRMSN